MLTYLIKRCAEDKGLSEDVMQRHKTWEKCLAYIYGRAKKQAVDNRAVAEDHIVYEWAEDYCGAFQGKGDEMCTGNTNCFGSGYHQYLWHTYCFDEESLQFVETGEPRVE